MNQSEESFIGWGSLFARLLLLGGAGLFLGAAFWPGSMTNDSITQYGQALTRNFNDWHPPVMAWLWSFLLPLNNGPAPMLCFHLAMLLTACFIMSSDKGRNGPQWAWLFIPLLPWISGISGAIWKDVGMTFSLFLGYALFQKVVSGGKNGFSRFLFTLSLWLFLYAMLVRFNAITMAPPLIYYPIRILRPECAKRKTFYMTCLCLLLLSCLTPFVYNILLGAKYSNPRSLMQIDEIAVTSVVAKKNLFSEVAEISRWPYEDLPRKQAATAEGWNFYGKAGAQLSSIQLMENWISVIVNYPLEYLQAKYILYRNFSAFPFKKRDDALMLEITENNNGFIRKGNMAEPILRKYVKFFIMMRWPFVPLFWVPMAFWLFWAARNRENATKYEIRMLSGSAICYYLGYILVTPTPDYRFIYWTVLGTTTAALVFYYSRQGRQGVS